MGAWEIEMGGRACRSWEKPLFYLQNPPPHPPKLPQHKGRHKRECTCHLSPPLLSSFLSSSFLLLCLHSFSLACLLFFSFLPPPKTQLFHERHPIHKIFHFSGGRDVQEGRRQYRQWHTHVMSSRPCHARAKSTAQAVKCQMPGKPMKCRG